MSINVSMDSLYRLLSGPRPNGLCSVWLKKKRMERSDIDVTYMRSVRSRCVQLRVVLNTHDQNKRVRPRYVPVLFFTLLQGSWELTEMMTVVYRAHCLLLLLQLGMRRIQGRDYYHVTGCRRQMNAYISSVAEPVTIQYSVIRTLPPITIQYSVIQTLSPLRCLHSIPERDGGNNPQCTQGSRGHTDFGAIIMQLAMLAVARGQGQGSYPWHWSPWPRHPPPDRRPSVSMASRNYCQNNDPRTAAE